MIKNILFDLGGVLLEVDMQITIEAFARLGWKETEMNGTQKRSGIFENLETGATTVTQFRESIRNILPGRQEDKEIDDAWNAMLVDFFPGIADYLLELKNGYSLFLLSNTNVLHLQRFRDIFFSTHGWHLDDLFTKTYYSHEIGSRKPDSMAYLKVLQDASLNPSETLFVDDLKINTDAASLLGMKVLNIQAGTLLETLPDYLQKRLGD